jgi:hypothetical protein
MAATIGDVMDDVTCKFSIDSMFYAGRAILVMENFKIKSKIFFEARAGMINNSRPNFFFYGALFSHKYILLTF